MGNCVQANKKDKGESKNGNMKPIKPTPTQSQDRSKNYLVEEHVNNQSQDKKNGGSDISPAPSPLKFHDGSAQKNGNQNESPMGGHNAFDIAPKNLNNDMSKFTTPKIFEYIHIILYR